MKEEKHQKLVSLKERHEKEISGKEEDHCLKKRRTNPANETRDEARRFHSKSQSERESRVNGKKPVMMMKIESESQMKKLRVSGFLFLRIK